MEHWKRSSFLYVSCARNNRIRLPSSLAGQVRQHNLIKVIRRNASHVKIELTSQCYKIRPLTRGTGKNGAYASVYGS